MKLDMLEYYKMLSNNNIGIIYSGPIWADGIEGIAATLRKRLEFDDLSLTAAQSVFSVFIEQMNNILMHSDEREKFTFFYEKCHEEARGLFVFGVSEKTYFIQSGNIIKNEKAEFLKESIDYVNSLDKSELRKFYRERLKSENPNQQSRGAGLGLIEIAKRASAKIEYDIKPFDEGFSFFSIFVKVGETAQ